MAATGGSAGGMTAGLIMGGFLCLGLFLLAIAATVVLSLISTFTSNTSSSGYGELYQLNALLLKSVYTNTTYTFKNGTVADSTALSSLCGTVYLALGAKSFAGCVASNFYAYSGANDSSTAKRRRRASNTAGLYMVGTIQLYYSSQCIKEKDKLKYSNSSSLSACVKNRLALCNNLYNSTTSFYQWQPLSDPFSLSVVDNGGLGYQPLTIQKLFAIPSYIALALCSSLGLSSQTQSLIGAGCQYIGPLSQTAIAAALAAQSSETTTQPTTSAAYG
jgi:hypothetical protein